MERFAKIVKLFTKGSNTFPHTLFAGGGGIFRKIIEVKIKIFYKNEGVIHIGGLFIEGGGSTAFH